MKKRAAHDRGEHVARLVMSVDFYERGGAVISVQRKKTDKRLLSPPVELLNQLEAYGRVVYAAELSALVEKKSAQHRYTEEDKAVAVAMLGYRSLSEVSRRTGASVNTLKRWAADAGVVPPDGHRVPDPPEPRAGSGQRTYGAKPVTESS